MANEKIISEASTLQPISHKVDQCGQWMIINFNQVVRSRTPKKEAIMTCSRCSGFHARTLVVRHGRELWRNGATSLRCVNCSHTMTRD